MLDFHVEWIKLKPNTIIFTIRYKKPRVCVLGIPASFVCDVRRGTAWKKAF